MRGIADGWGITALGAICVLGAPTIASGQAARAGVVTTLQGTATVARSTAPQPMPLKFKDDVFIQDSIVTGESSIVRILLGGKAVVTVRERSALTIHETPTTSTIEVSSGKIALAVAKDRMKPGESVQIKTPNAMAGVRGTVVIADVAAPVQVGGTVTTRFTLLTGIVDVTQIDASTGQPTGQPVMLHPLQTITVTGHTPPGAARGISRTEAQKIASDYKVSLPTPPAAANTEVTERQVELAVQHSAALTGGPSGNGNGNGEGTGGVLEQGSTSNGGSAGRNNGGGSTTGGGGTSSGGTVNAGGGGVGGGGSVSVGGGGIGAGGGISVGGSGGIGAGGGVTVGGGGIGVGVGAGVGGVGAGVGVTVGGGGIGAGGGVTVGGGGTGGGITVGGGGTGGGGGLIGGLIPRLPRRP
jgi:hypothetical protein